MEAHRVLRLDKVEVKLRFALEVARLGELLIRLARGARRFEIVDEVYKRVHGKAAQFVGALLDGFHASLQLRLRPAVTALAGVVDVEQRAAHVVIADLGGTDADVGHMTISARYARAGMNALVP